MQIDEIFRIWDKFENSNATEFVYETKDDKLALKKGGNVILGSVPDTVVGAGVQTAPQGAPALAPSEPAPSGTVVKAPFVGTFYRASAPGAEPFVKIGQKVKKGDIVGIIEAMKLMNEITAPCDGTVTDIYVDDETMVEYDQNLVCIGE